MKTFIITGYSGKTNGLLMVVDAEDERSALEKLARVQIGTLVAVEDEEGVRRCFLALNGEDETSIKEDITSGEAPRWYYEIWIQELKKDVCLHTCW